MGGVDDAIMYFESNRKIDIKNNFETIISKHISSFPDSNKKIKFDIINCKYRDQPCPAIENEIKNLMKPYGIRFAVLYVGLDSKKFIDPSLILEKNTV